MGGIAPPFIFNHEITRIFTRNLFLERKALPTTFLPSVKTFSLLSFSTGFLFVNEKVCRQDD